VAAPASACASINEKRASSRSSSTRAEVDARLTVSDGRKSNSQNEPIVSREGEGAIPPIETAKLAKNFVSPIHRLEFIDENGGGPGVRLRKHQRKKS
jgi:hypothetical protein